MFLIKFMLVHLSQRLTGELIAYIRRHPAPTRRPSVCQYYQTTSPLKPFCRYAILHRSITGLGGSELHVVCFILIGEELDTCRSVKYQVLQCKWGFFTEHN